MQGVTWGPVPPPRPDVRAGGAEAQMAPPQPARTPFGIPADLLQGLEYRDGALRVPAAKIQDLLRQYVGNKAKVELREGQVRLHISDSADVWTTLTPTLVDGNGVRVAFSDTRWKFFIFGGRVKPEEARDRALKEIGKKVRPAPVDQDDVEEYREKEAEIAKWRDRQSRLQALSTAGEKENAEKLRDLDKKIARMEQRLAGKEFAKVRASLEQREPTVSERIGGSMRADGTDALRFDLPLPPGFQVSNLEISPDGFAFRVRGPAAAPAMLPAAPMPAASSGQYVPLAPVRLESPVPGLPGHCQPIGDIWKLRTA
ncbi:MAG: hypothetical protein FJZ01_11520 [Candidatus Sericytochromatia bacterium]|nr:hypothetical protein [Candidatus Tanganyikabacteria bacterium]